MYKNNNLNLYLEFRVNVNSFNEFVTWKFVYLLLENLSIEFYASGSYSFNVGKIFCNYISVSSGWNILNSNGEKQLYKNISQVSNLYLKFNVNSFNKTFIFNLTDETCKGRMKSFNNKIRGI